MWCDYFIPQTSGGLEALGIQARANRTEANNLVVWQKIVHSGAFQVEWLTVCRAALKGTNLRGQTPICGFLRVPAVFCGFLRKSAVFCENLRSPSASFSRKRRESAKISENLRKSAFGLGLSPQVRPVKRALSLRPNVPRPSVPDLATCQGA